MSTRVDRISALLGAIVADVPVGTKLGLFWLFWALISGRFLLSRGAVFPALADLGLPADAVRRSGAALTSGGWTVQPLVRTWHQLVEREGRWRAHTYEGFRPVACDLVGFFRPLSWLWWRRLDRSGQCVSPCCVSCCGLPRAPGVKRRCNVEPYGRQEPPCTAMKCWWSMPGSASPIS
jgi:hypothetical protein